MPNYWAEMFKTIAIFEIGTLKLVKWQSIGKIMESFKIWGQKCPIWMLLGHNFANYCHI